MYVLLLGVGFGLNVASAFTAAWCRRCGERRGRATCALLRIAIAPPLWVAGFCLAVRQPAGFIVVPGLVQRGAALVLILAGAGLVIAAVGSLGHRAVAPGLGDTLVTGGLYARVRHPMYTGVLLQLAGLAGWRPTPPVLLACALGAGWIWVQARAEEMDLLQRLPGYGGYLARVPRFVPRWLPPRNG